MAWLPNTTAACKHSGEMHCNMHYYNLGNLLMPEFVLILQDPGITNELAGIMLFS
jgi:hypothetical protein